MRFLDSNIFIYAYYRPRRTLSKHEKWMKDKAKEIVKNISEGEEEIITTVIHLSEIINILKHRMVIEDLIDFVIDLYSKKNITILSIDAREFFVATELGRELKLDPNDALAVKIMYENDLKEIYSFDKDFDRIENIVRLPILEEK